jgi:phage FluMu gp28-like protein
MAAKPKVVKGGAKTPAAPKPAAVPLHAYQRKWFLDQARFKIGMFARQTGKTFTTTLELVDDCFANALRSTAARWVILSRGERQAKEAMDEGVKKHARAYQLGVESVEYDWKTEAGTVFKALEVKLPHGSRITALPANPDTARGFSANVMLDEFAFHADSKRIWGALFPVISAGWRMRIVSTPNGKGNKFYELMTGKDTTWSRHMVDIYQAVADGLPRDVEELKNALNDQDLWEQEFELKWLDEASAWLSYELITSCEDENAGDPAGYQGGQCYVGNDIARRNDLWVAWVWEKIGDVLWTREIVTLKRASFATQDAALDEIMTKYNVVRVAMDQTGMGEKPVEDAIRRYGAHRVEGVLMNGARPLNLAIHGKQKFEDRRVRIPMGDPVLRADLHKLKKVPGLTGAPRLVAESDSAGHADRTWAGFLGIAASEGSAPAAGASVPPRKEVYMPRAQTEGGRGRLLQKPPAPNLRRR